MKDTNKVGHISHARTQALDLLSDVQCLKMAKKKKGGVRPVDI